MTSPDVGLSAIGRAELEALVFDLRASRHRLEVELARVVRERDHYFERVKELQAHSTAQLEALRALRAGHAQGPMLAGGAFSPLPGWTCACGVFNGEAKTVRAECRACGAVGGAT